MLIVQPELASSPSPFRDIFPPLAADLASRDHAVTLFNATREDVHSAAGVNTVKPWTTGMMSSPSSVVSFFGRLLFSLQLLLHATLRLKPYDVMLVRGKPPIWMGLTAMLIQFFRGTKFVYHAPVLYPEAAAILNGSKLGWRMKLASKIERWICDTAKAVIVPTLDMVDTLRDRGVRNESVALLSQHQPEVPDPATPLPESLHRDFDRFRVLYIGDMSAAENLEFVGDAAFLLRDRHDIEFIFMGDGPQKAELRELCGPAIGKTVFFHDWLSDSQASSLSATSDLAIISLLPQMLEAMYPANASLYLSGGCEILASIDLSSDLAVTINRQQLGVVVDRRTGRAIADAILDRFDIWKSLGSPGNRRKPFPHDQQIRDAEAWCQLLERIAGFSSPKNTGAETPVENFLR